MSLEQFICEVLDVGRIDLKTDATFASFMKNNILQYDAIWSCPIVLRNLEFCWSFKKMFGIYPSKFLIIENANVGANASASSNVVDAAIKFGQVVDFIFAHSFHRFNATMADEFKKNAADLLVQFSAYLVSLQDKAFVKHELYNKLRDRVVGSVKCAYEPGSTLYAQFKKLVGIENPYVDLGKSMFSNPITGFAPKKSKDMNMNMNVISRYDVYKWVYFSDYYFARLLTAGPCLVTTCEDFVPEFEHFGLVIATGTSNATCANATCANVFVTTSAILRDCATCVPRLNMRCVCIGEGAVSLGKSTLALVKSEAEDKHVFSLIANSKIDLFVNGGKNCVSMPLEIKQGIVELYKKCIANANANASANTSAISLSRFNANCVLLIDTRPNILSVMATLITMSNLRKNTWDLVIVTNKAALDFYRGYFGDNATYITDVPQLVMNANANAKFNIENYNRLLKDAAFWSRLSNYAKCLTVQDDALIAYKGLEETFMEFDYVGAPWPVAPHLAAAGVGPDCIGNGGLSLRDVATMIDITQFYVDEKNVLFNSDMQPIPEDVYFSACIEKRGGRMPSRDLASRFAMEMYQAPHNNQPALGIHKPWPYLGTKVVVDYLADATAAAAVAFAAASGKTTVTPT